MNSVIVKSNQEFNGKIKKVNITGNHNTLFGEINQKLKKDLQHNMSEISKLDQNLIIKKLIMKQLIFK